MPDQPQPTERDRELAEEISRRIPTMTGPPFPDFIAAIIARHLAPERAEHERKLRHLETAILHLWDAYDPETEPHFANICLKCDEVENIVVQLKAKARRRNRSAAQAGC